MGRRRPSCSNQKKSMLGARLGASFRRLIESSMLSRLAVNGAVIRNDHVNSAGNWEKALMSYIGRGRSPFLGERCGQGRQGTPRGLGLSRATC